MNRNQLAVAIAVALINAGMGMDPAKSEPLPIHLANPLGWSW